MERSLTSKSLERSASVFPLKLRKVLIKRYLSDPKHMIAHEKFPQTIPDTTLLKYLNPNGGCAGKPYWQKLIRDRDIITMAMFERAGDIEVSDRIDLRGSSLKNKRGQVKTPDEIWDDVLPVTLTTPSRCGISTDGF